MRRKRGKKAKSLTIPEQIAKIARSIGRTGRRSLSDPNAKIYYVYALVDPRDNEIFYIGKGKGNRCHVHSKKARQPSDRSNGRKRRRILSIQAEGLAVGVTFVATDLNEAQAFAREREEIAARKARGERLTNANGGGSYGHNLIDWINRCLWCYGSAGEYGASVMRRERRMPTQEEWVARAESIRWFLEIRQMLKDEIARKEVA